MQALYQKDMSETSLEDVMTNAAEDEVFTADTISFTEHIVNGVIENQKKIDETIERISKDWPMNRMSVVDKSILRSAVFELLFEKETPKAVVIDEAVELAKKYSSEKAQKFINGILGAVARE